MKTFYQILKNVKWELIFPIAIWLMMWGGYNTGIEKMLSESFFAVGGSASGGGVIDFLHGIRALFPIFALMVVIIIFFVKRIKLPEKFFLTPLGLFSIYAIAGIISSVYSANMLVALYWAIMYGCPLFLVCFFVIGGNSSVAIKENIKAIINVNWLVAASIGLILFLSFLAQTGILYSLNDNLLFCQQRIYEGLSGVPHESQILGMVGSRPTGFARYSGIVALLALWMFFSNKDNAKLRVFWFSLFVVFLIMLLFSKGKTELVAFVPASLALIWFYKKLKTFWVILPIVVAVFGFVIIFYKIPCSKEFSIVSYVQSQLAAHISVTDNNAKFSLATPKPKSLIEQSNIGQPNLYISNKQSEPPIDQSKINEKPAVSPEQIKSESTKKILSLSGRVNGVWKDSWNLFLTSPVIGYGFQADRMFLQGQHAHNSIIHALVQTGLLGTVPLVGALVLTIIFLFSLFKEGLIDKKEKVFLVAISSVLVFILIRGITESFAFYSADWLFLAPIIAYIQVLYFNKKKEA